MFVRKKKIRLCAWKIGWKISLSGSVSASLYRTYTVQVMTMLGDMEDFFKYWGVIGRDDDIMIMIMISILSIHFK